MSLAQFVCTFEPASAAMFLGLDPFRLLLLPVVMMIFSCFSLLSFKTLLLALTRSTKVQYDNEIVSTYVQPALKHVLKLLEEVVGEWRAVASDATRARARAGVEGDSRRQAPPE